MASDSRLPFFSVPLERNTEFFGCQNALAAIDRALAQRHKHQQQDLWSFALCGIGGIGKSEIALEYVHSRRAVFDAVFWLRADKEQVLSLDFTQIAEDLSLLDKKDVARDPIQAIDSVKAWLSAPPSGATWLLVFDNVDTLDVINEFWPSSAHGAILVTSRYPLAQLQNSRFSVQQGVDLEPLGHEDTINLLESLWAPELKGQSDQDDLDALGVISSRVAGWPILIAHVAGLMRRQQTSPQETLSILKNLSGENSRALLASSLANFSLDNLDAKIGLSGLSTFVRHLLDVMSVLDPDRIQESILRASMTTKHTLSYSLDLLEYSSAVKQLTRSSLIFHDRARDEFRLHRIVQSTTWCSLNDAAKLRALKIALASVSTIWPFCSLEDRFETSRYSACGLAFPHAERLREAFEDFTINKLPQDDFLADAADLFNGAGWYCFERGYANDANQFYVMSQQLIEHSGMQDNEREAAILRETQNNLGSLADEMNDPHGGLRHNQSWLQLCQNNDAKVGTYASKYELALAYNEIGVALAYNGRISEAIDSFLTSMESFLRLQDTKLPLSWPQPNLGFLYWVTGRQEEAERTLLEILRIREDAYGVDDEQSFKTGKVLYALGNVCTSQGRFQEGVSYHSRVYHQYQATLGHNHHRVGDVSHRLADHALRDGNLEAASTYLAHALKIFSSRSYFRHQLARSLFKEAQILKACGKNYEAGVKSNEAFNLRQTLRPGDLRPLSQLAEKDFDDLVIFWSR